MSALVPPPPQLMVPAVAYGGGEGGAEGSAVRGSYGPVIAMLAVLAVLAAAAVAVGRLCFGRRVLGQARGHHDLEAWVERTCGPCVGAGSMFSSPPAANPGDLQAKEEDGGTVVAVTVTAPEERSPEATERREDSGSGGDGDGDGDGDGSLCTM